LTKYWALSEGRERGVIVGHTEVEDSQACGASLIWRGLNDATQ
jgi:hypothetical protein